MISPIQISHDLDRNHSGIRARVFRVAHLVDGTRSMTGRGVLDELKHAQMRVIRQQQRDLSHRCIVDLFAGELSLVRDNSTVTTPHRYGDPNGIF